MCVWGFTGLPLCSLSSALGFFVSGALQSNQSLWTPVSFLLAAAMVSLITLIIRSVRQLQLILLVANGALCLALPVIRYLTSGFGWIQAIEQGNVALMFIDAVLLLCGVWCFYRVYASNQAQESDHTATEAVASEHVGTLSGAAK